MSLLGEELKNIRDKKNRSQRSVATQMGISAQYLSNVERGKCVLAPMHIKSASKALRVRTSALVELAVADYRATVTSRMKTQVSRVSTK